MDISLYTDGEQATAAVLNRPLKQIETRLTGEESRAGGIMLGNSDWTKLVQNQNGIEYSEEYQGILVTGNRTIALDMSKISIDPNREYTIKIRIRKIKNNDKFYAGVKSFDKNGNHLSSDQATNYNYGVASNVTQTQGNIYNYSGTFKGYNKPEESINTKFDPGATHFVPLILVNYGGNSTSESVIEMLEVKVHDTQDELRFQKRIGYGPYANAQTFYVGGDSDKFYPVIIPIRNTHGGPRQFSITRPYSAGAPYDWNNSSTHHGGLELMWEDVSTTYSANLQQVRIVRHWSVYTRIFAGMQKIGAGAGWTVMYLRGGNAFYQLNSDYKYLGYEKVSLEDIEEYQAWIDLQEEGDTATSTSSTILNRNGRNSETIYVLDEPVEVQKIDENGDLVFELAVDENGDPIYVQETDENGDPAVDENGDPIYVQEKIPVMVPSTIPLYRQYYRPDSGSKWSYKYNTSTSYFTLSDVNSATTLLTGESYLKNIRDSGKDETEGAQFGLWQETSYYGSAYNLGGAR